MLTTSRLSAPTVMRASPAHAPGCSKRDRKPPRNAPSTCWPGVGRASREPCKSAGDLQAMQRRMAAGPSSPPCRAMPMPRARPSGRNTKAVFRSRVHLPNRSSLPAGYPGSRWHLARQEPRLPVQLYLKAGAYGHDQWIAAGAPPTPPWRSPPGAGVTHGAAGKFTAIGGGADGLPGRCACDQTAVLYHEDAAHQDVTNSLRWDFAFLVRGPVLDRGRIENREVRVGSGLNPPLLLHGGHPGFQPLGGH